MAKRQKGERVESGVWKHPTGKGYIAEVSFPDPQTGKRVRKQRWIHRLDLAREWRESQKTDALRGEVRRRTNERQPRAFDQFADEYLENWAKVKKRPTSYVRDRSIVKHLKNYFAQKKLDAITLRDIEQYMAKRVAEGLKPATVLLHERADFAPDLNRHRLLG